MSKIILHIPHSSTTIPLKYGYQVNDAFLMAKILKLTDWYTEWMTRIDFLFQKIYTSSER